MNIEYVLEVAKFCGYKWVSFSQIGNVRHNYR